MSRRLRIALYGEINMNLVDGSSIWLQSVAQTLTQLDSVEVLLLLKFPEERGLLTEPLRASSQVDVIDPRSIGHAAPLGPADAATALERLDAERRFDLFLLRGLEVSERACEREAFAGRVWLYYLPWAEERLPALAPRAARILCQTDALRASAEALVPDHAEKLSLLPPMIPPPAGEGSPRLRDSPLRLVYAGKFAPEYCFLEMVSLFERFRQHQPDARLELIGDKIHQPPDDPGFRAAAERALRETPNLLWQGGLSRSETQARLRGADVALSIRHPRMVHSKELSTKVLEYGAAGCAVLLNRTPLYEELLGSDYPLFVRDPDEAFDTLARVAQEPELVTASAERCELASRNYVYDRVAARLEHHLPRPAEEVSTPRPRLLIAGHDLRFVGELRKSLGGAGVEVREDLWEGDKKHSVSRSRELSSRADMVLCEWCLGNAVWYSHNALPDQRLVVRLHRVELQTSYPLEAAIDRINAWVFVAEHILQEALERFSLPSSRLMVIQNLVDVERFERPKLPDATFNLGMIGFVDSRKRLDRALDILERLRAADSRFRLILKGKPPWEYPWVKRRDDQRRYYEDVYRRISESPLLRDSVTFEEFGINVAAFLQKVRFLLSTSDHEGDQVAVAEAAASGAIPVVLERAGAAEQYPSSWVHPSEDLAADAVLDLVYWERAEDEGARAVAFAKDRWSAEAVAPLWAEALGLSEKRAFQSSMYSKSVPRRMEATSS